MKFPPAISAWEQLVEARKQFFSFWVGLSLAAVALALAPLVGVKDVRWPVVVLSLLASHALTAWVALGKIAQLQAALDMKRLARGEEVG